MTSLELYLLIQQHAADSVAANDWDTVAATMNALGKEEANEQLWTVGDLIELLGMGQAAIVLGRLEEVGAVNPIVRAAYYALTARGISLHQPERQAMIAQIGANWSAKTLEALQAAAVKFTPTVNPSLTGEQYQVNYNKGKLEHTWGQLVNNGINEAINNGDVAGMIAKLRDAANTLEAS